MKKRVFSCLLVVALLIAQIMTVSAAPSKSAQFGVTSGSASEGYAVTDSDEATPTLPDGKNAVTGVKTLTYTGAAKDTYTVSFYVPNLTSDLVDGLGIYYTINGTDWFCLDATSVDLANKTVTFDLPEGNVTFVIVSNGEVLVDATVGTAPKTGVASTWMAWIMAAMVLAATAVVLGKKRTA